VYGALKPEVLAHLAGEASIATADLRGADGIKFTHVALIMTSGNDCGCWYQVIEPIPI
jgi:hypothetical protein